MSKIKLFKASPFYSDVFSSIPAEDNYSNISYDSLYKRNMDTLFGWADFWKIHLEDTGKFEVREVISNNMLLQKIWAKEHKVPFSRRSWCEDILEAQLMEFQPDIFFAHDYSNISSIFLKKIKKKIPSIKLVLGWDGLCYKDLKFYESYDVLLTPVKSVSEFYNEAGKKAYFFPFGFETSILEKIEINENKKHILTFSGSLINRNNFHKTRIDLLGELVKRTSINVRAASFPTKKQVLKWHPFLAPKQILRLLSARYTERDNYWHIGKLNLGPVYGKDMYQELYDSRLLLNSHIDVAQNSAANIRLFEATGLGTCLITDYKDNISDFFMPDQEVVTYKSVPECIDKIEYLIDNPHIADKIGKAGQEKTLGKYSLENRIKSFSEILVNLIG